MHETTHKKPFLPVAGLTSFGDQIVNILYKDSYTRIADDNEYIVYRQSLNNGVLEIGKDMDVLLGFTTTSKHPVMCSLYVSNIEIAQKEVRRGEFVSALDTGECIPLTSLEDYKVSCKVFPEGATVECLIGRLRNLIMRVKVKEHPWKYICYHRRFFILRCANLQIHSITHIRDFEDIPDLPNIQQHVDHFVEEWKKQKSQERVDYILEELIAKTWHPSRHIEWCLDIEDRAMLGFPV